MYNVITISAAIKLHPKPEVLAPAARRALFQLVGQPCAFAWAPVDPEILAAVAQQGFHLGIAFQGLRKAPHLRLDLLARLDMPAGRQRPPLGLQRLPALDEALGPHPRIGQRRPFSLHAGDELPDPLPASQLGEDTPRLRIMLQGRLHQLVRTRPRLVKLLPRNYEFLLLPLEERKPLANLPIGGTMRPCVTVSGRLEGRRRPHPLCQTVAFRRRLMGEADNPASRTG